jgi:phosphoribosylaminoimidazole (AIR) synthetase
MGIGFVLVVPQEAADSVCRVLAGNGAAVIGTVVPGDGGVCLLQ